MYILLVISDIQLIGPFVNAHIFVSIFVYFANHTFFISATVPADPSPSVM